MRLSVLALALAFGLTAAAAEAATIAAFQPGGAVTFETGDPAFRAKGPTGGREFYLGVTDLGVGANRVEAEHAYGAAQAFSFGYTRATGQISGLLGTTALSFAGTAGAGFNAVYLHLKGAGKDGALFSVTNLAVNGEALGNLAPGTGFHAFVLTRFADLPVLTVTGSLVTRGTLNRNDNERLGLEMRLGTAPVPLPAALPLLMAALGGMALAARRRRAA